MLTDNELFTKLIHIARAGMKEGCCKHACFAISYTNAQGFYTEELADSENDIRYFFNDKAYEKFVEETRNRYAASGIADVAFYTVHAR